MRHKVTGIVLAGGKSSRMGTEKGLVSLNGKALINYALDALSPVCDEMIISSNSSAYDSYGYQVIPDIHSDSGPMGGIYSCLLKSGNDLNFVLSCDTPLITSNVVSNIIVRSPGYDVTVPWHGGQLFEPLCTVYHKNTIPVFEHFIKTGNFKIPDLIANVNTNKLRTGEDTPFDPLVFYNVNSKKQLLELENLTGFNKLSGLDHLPNLLMIAGTGRKVGKTTLACNIIKHISKNHPVVGIKISPHLHQQAKGQEVITQTNDYVIIEETNVDTAKDSSRMLQTGANKVYYIQTKDRNIKAAFQILMDLIPANSPIICESGALLDYAKPGLFLLVKREGQTAFKKGIDQLPYTPDRWITFDGMDFDLVFSSVSFSSDGFSLIE